MAAKTIPAHNLKLHDLKTKLDCSTALVELSYDNKAGKQPKQPHQQRQPRKSLVAASPAKVDSKDDSINDTASCRSSPSRLSKHGKSVRTHNNNYTPFISEDEMLNRSWNETDETTASVALEQEYLSANAVMSDDANRAGDHVPFVAI